MKKKLSTIYKILPALLVFLFLFSFIAKGQTLPGSPGEITGSSLFCIGSGNGFSYSVGDVTNATSYKWTVIGGEIIMGQGTKGLLVNWTSTQNAQISVRGVNSAGEGPVVTRSISAYAVPGPLGPVTGPSSICAGQNYITYLIPALPAGQSVYWDVPAGMSHGGVQYTGSNQPYIVATITSEFKGGEMNIYASTGPCTIGIAYKVSYVSAASATASTIVGDNVIYDGQTAAKYTVPLIDNASSYQWSVPAGASIVSGLNTNSVVVYFSNTFAGGNISVYGTNCVGAGTASSIAVTKNATKGPDILLNSNTVRADVVKTSGITSGGALTSDNVQTNISYMDGLGRPYQRLAVNASGSGTKDLVEFMRYDKDGMQPVQYLPYVSSGQTGRFQSNAVVDQAAFYNTPGDKIADDAFPFAVTTYDGTPLNRVLEVGAPGADWQPGKQTVKTSVRFNTASDAVRVWFPTGPTTTFYLAGELSVNEVTDENSNKVIQYTNQLGQVVLKKVQADASTYLQTVYVYNALGNVVYQVSPEAVKAVEAATTAWTTDLINKFVLKYTYDTKNRLVEKKAPGAEPVQMVYDRFDRLVLTQDGKLRTNTPASGRWYFTKFDILYRPVISGIYRYVDLYPSLTSLTPREKLQKYFDEVVYNTTTTLSYEKRLAGTTYGYSNLSFPTSITDADVLSVNYYDDYNFNNSTDGSADYSYLNPNSTGTSNSGNQIPVNTLAPYTDGMLTGTRKKVIGATGWIIEAVFYDDNGNPIQKRSNNLINQTVADVTSNAYDSFTGKLLATKQVKQTGVNSVTVVNKLAYDINDRLTRVIINTNGGTDKILAEYKYNELGQLVDKRLGVTDGPANSGSVRTGTTIESSAYDNYDIYSAVNQITLSPGFQFAATASKSFTARIGGGTGGNALQSVDYRYNIRGWLTNINNSKLSNDGGETNDDHDDVFGISLLYNNQDVSLANSKTYNGRISAVKWQTNDRFVVNNSNLPQRERSYKFTYDKVDRLTSANYSAWDGSGWNAETGAYDESMTYDFNGNILNLTRYTKDNETTTRSLIDNLTYVYKGTTSNQLAKVSDGSNNILGFKNGTNTDDDYTYDLNGNLLTDANKGATITYNDLNKTSTVVFSSTQQLQYIYDAGGNRIRKIVINGAVTTTYDYIDGFVYRNSTLNYFSTLEGKVRTSGSTLTYEYFIKDHMGNVRVSFEDNGSGLARIVQENHYYPFGLTMKGIANRSAVPSEKNLLLFNAGSELQEDFGFEHSYSTFFREYDPAIGRFNAIDPMVDRFASWTPYNFAFNDPINFNDPLGDQADGPGRDDWDMRIRNGPQGQYDYNTHEFQWDEGLSDSYARLGLGNSYADQQKTAAYMAFVKSHSAFTQTSDGTWVRKSDYLYISGKDISNAIENGDGYWIDAGEEEEYLYTDVNRGNRVVRIKTIWGFVPNVKQNASSGGGLLLLLLFPFHLAMNFLGKN